MSRSTLSSRPKGGICFCLLVAVLLAVAVNDLTAQYTDDVVVGARVRVWPGPHNSNDWFVGTLTSVTRDSLYIQPCATCPPRPVARFDVTRLNVSEGPKKFDWERAGLGALFAGTLGGILGYGVGSEADKGCTWLCFATAQMTMVGMVVGSTTGLIVGGLARGEQWR
jgi:hypothetical protein